MKKLTRPLALLLMLALLLCLPGAASAREASLKERLVRVYFTDTEMELTERFPLYFADGAEDLPYVELESWADILYVLNQDFLGDEGYDITVYRKGDSVFYLRENGYSLEFDFAHDKLIFDDYDAFVHRSDDTTLIDLLTETGYNENGEAQLFHRDTSVSFDRYGDVMTVDLGAYGIEMIRDGGKYYVPLQTMNDFLVSPSLLTFLYNGRALYLANDEILFDYTDGTYTDYAEEYYDVRRAKRSPALAEYSYNELCLVLDTFYGLKDAHEIDSFRKLFWQIGYDEALTGSDPTDADRALMSFIDYYLDDLHSAFCEFSWMSGIHSISGSGGMADRKMAEHEERYGAAREAFYPDGCPGYEEVGNTAYVTFDVFDSSYYGDAFYSGLETGDIPDDTLGLIIYAHSRITRPGSPIENVVLDLSNNGGGAVDAAVFVLGWILGDAPFSVKDMATGAMSTSIYRADVNLDRVFDERDTIADKNIFCLISPVSFSAGNLVPAALKSSQKATLIGQTTGGGSCVVRQLSTAYGSVFQISSELRMSFLKNGSFYDIDQGVEPDHYITHIENLYDRELMTRFINALT